MAGFGKGGNLGWAREGSVLVSSVLGLNIDCHVATQVAPRV